MVTKQNETKVLHLGKSKNTEPLSF